MYKGKKVIGICSTGLDEKFHMKMINRLFRELYNNDYYVMVFGMESDLFYFTDNDEGETSIYDLMNYELLDGIIIFPETIKQDRILDEIVDHATDAGVFVVSVGKELRKCYNVVYDISSSFEKLVRHVIEYHNLKEVNFMAGTEGNEVSESRIEIYKNVLEENDIFFEEERVGYGEFWEGPTRKVMDKFMDPSKVPPEAIICANDSMAIAVCDYLKEHNINVPEDIIVTGIDGIDEGVKHVPGITTCVRHEVNDAKKIVGMINDLSEGRILPTITEFAYHIQLSQSCGCQENYLFDPVSLVSELNTIIATDKADMRNYAQMSEEFLTCSDMDTFKELISKYIPDNSFICINSDLKIDMEKDNDHHSGDNAFTTTMNVISKDQGNVTYSECERKNVLPDLEQLAIYDKPVILLPIHFSNKVVGYLGTWICMDQKIDMGRVIRFLSNFNNSAGVKLCKSGRL